MHIIRVFKLRIRHHQILLDKAKVLVRPACIVLEAIKKDILQKKSFINWNVFSLQYRKFALRTIRFGMQYYSTIGDKVAGPFAWIYGERKSVDPSTTQLPLPLPPQQVAILSPIEVTTLESKSWFIYWQTNFCRSEIINLADWILRMKNDEKIGSKYTVKYITWIFLHSFQTRGK